MLNLKSNVYRNEWLELVFANRNKLYGAYELRRDYSSRLLKAMLLSVTLFVGLIAGPFLYDKFILQTPLISNQAGLYKETDHQVYLMPKELPKPPVPAQARAEAAAPLKTLRNTVPVIVPSSEVTVEIPTHTELENAVISNQETKGINAAPGTNGIETGSGTNVQDAGNEIISGNEPVLFAEQMPEFPGGQEAFSKFLSKNLKYPAQAQDNNIQGRVTVSFIVETNGNLTDIRILRGIGSGCDEEAIRVLKKAPAWRPGKQNGRNVRVQYTIPIVFNLGE